MLVQLVATYSQLQVSASYQHLYQRQYLIMTMDAMELRNIVTKTSKTRIGSFKTMPLCNHFIEHFQEKSVHCQINLMVNHATS